MYDIFLSDTSLIFVGYADIKGPGNSPYGAGGTAPATSDAAWTIKKIVFDSGVPIQTLWTEAGQGVWDDRNSETYV